MALFNINFHQVSDLRALLKRVVAEDHGEKAKLEKENVKPITIFIFKIFLQESLKREVLNLKKTISVVSESAKSLQDVADFQACLYKETDSSDDYGSDEDL